METLLQLHAEGITIVLITHFMEEAVQADRVVVIQEGVLAEEGTPHTVFSQAERLRNMGLDVPVAAEVADWLRRRQVHVPSQVITKEELGDILCP